MRGVAQERRVPAAAAIGRRRSRLACSSTMRLGRRCLSSCQTWNRQLVPPAKGTGKGWTARMQEPRAAVAVAEPAAATQAWAARRRPIGLLLPPSSPMSATSTLIIAMVATLCLRDRALLLLLAAGAGWSGGAMLRELDSQLARGRRAELCRAVWAAPLLWAQAREATGAAQALQIIPIGEDPGVELSAPSPAAAWVPPSGGGARTSCVEDSCVDYTMHFSKVAGCG